MQDRASHARAAFPDVCLRTLALPGLWDQAETCDFLETRAGNLHPGSPWESVTAYSEKVMILPATEASACVILESS